MMALQMLLLLEVIVILFCPTTPYPVYGTKRYGGSSNVQRVSSWPPYHQMVRTQRYPVNYYEMYPYPDEYYQPDSYPYYYPPARTSKYEVYQAVLPYYYSGHPSYQDDPMTDIQEEIMQEMEREEREDAQPIGHEMLYENEDDNLDDVNAAFLQNLIASEMYRNAAAADNQNYYDDFYQAAEDYNTKQHQETSTRKEKSRHRQEDEDVRELKQLAKPKNKGKKKQNKQQKQKEAEEDVHWLQRSNFRDNYRQQAPINNNYDEKRDKIVATTLAPPKRDARGQKEEVLMRPATPVRHPFSSPVMEMMSKNDDRKRTPSVYDTIKHMLDMEKSLENKYDGEIRPHMQKRYVTSEEDLIRQLNVLKKQ